MPDIPSSINGVTVDFASTVGKDVAVTMIDGLKHCIKTDIASGHTLTSIHLSSANDSHTSPSRHAIGRAVDISRINGTKIYTGYPADAAVRAITDAIQDAFEGFAQRRENYGPKFRKKLGSDWAVSGHDDHIHISVN